VDLVIMAATSRVARQRSAGSSRTGRYDVRVVAMKRAPPKDQADAW